MKNLTKNLLAFFLVFALAASCISIAYSQGSSEKAKQILERAFQKYRDLFKKDARGLNSVAAKISIKGGGEMPMGESGDMSLDVDATVEIYAARPHNLYLDISGNLGNAKLAVTGKEKVTATIILPSTKQFATIDVPQKVLQEAQEGDPQEPERIKEFWEEVILTYEGTENIKAGKAHKITIKPKDPAEKSFVTAHILDDRWDPARFEINDPEEGNKLVVEFEKLELNINIPDERFVPDTQGYTQVSDKDITTAIMMQIMTAVMQQSKEE